MLNDGFNLRNLHFLSNFSTALKNYRGNIGFYRDSKEVILGFIGVLEEKMEITIYDMFEEACLLAAGLWILVPAGAGA